MNLNQRRPSSTSESAQQHLAIWLAAILAGGAAVAFTRLIGFAQTTYFHYFALHPLAVSFLSPWVFLIAAALVHFFAPDAKGSGIPQILLAIEESNEFRKEEKIWYSPLISIKTAFIKMISACFGILGGASIGREGPTVQIASSVFAFIGRRLKKIQPTIDTHSFLIAGAASGVAAAFNTPIAGIAFAIEEIMDGAFAEFRQIIMLAVIIAGITAQALAGDYLFFGHPQVSKAGLILGPEVLLIGVLGGCLGGVFSYLLSHPKHFKLPSAWYLRALICGAICSLIGWYQHGDTAGSGYEVTRQSLDALSPQDSSLTFPFFKITSTLLSYFSGIAGGIFSPSLSIGSGIGLAIAKIMHFENFKVCALLGMVAYFSSVVQAPLTGVIIVMEMTDEHILILPFMLTAFLSQMIGKKFMPVPLYHQLAKQYFAKK